MCSSEPQLSKCCLKIGVISLTCIIVGVAIGSYWIYKAASPKPLLLAIPTQLQILTSTCVHANATLISIFGVYNNGAGVCSTSVSVSNCANINPIYEPGNNITVWLCLATLQDGCPCLDYDPSTPYDSGSEYEIACALGITITLLWLLMVCCLFSAKLYDHRYHGDNPRVVPITRISPAPQTELSISSVIV